MNAFSSHIDELQNSLQAVNDNTPQIVENLLQPIVQTQETHTTRLQQHSDNIASFHISMQTSDKQREAQDCKIDTLNKTWETLFQHMVSQVKEDTLSLRIIKTQSEALLKEVRIAVATLEEKFEDFVTEQSSAQSELKAELQLNMLRKNALQAKIESWSVEMDAAMENMLALRDESRGIQSALKKAQYQQTKADSWKRLIEEDVRQSKKDQLEIGKALEELKGARSVREHKLLDMDVDKFEKYAVRARKGRAKETVAKQEICLKPEREVVGECRDVPTSQGRE